MVTLDIDLPTLKAAAKSLGGNVNDVYLAAMCGAVRRYQKSQFHRATTCSDDCPCGVDHGLGAAAEDALDRGIVDHLVQPGRMRPALG